MTRTLTTRTGKTVDTDLTDAQALSICRTLTGSSFAQKLVFQADHGNALSTEQITWTHIIAVWSKTPQSAQAVAVQIAFAGMAVIVTMFERAAQHIKFPKIRLRTEDKDKVVLAYKSEKGKIYVSDGGPFGDNMYYGAISLDTGAFMAARACTQAVKDTLARFAGDPAGVAAQYGFETNECCFCMRSLTEADSVAAGYGAVCADRYGLPHSGMAAARKSSLDTHVMVDRQAEDALRADLIRMAACKMIQTGVSHSAMGAQCALFACCNADLTERAAEFCAYYNMLSGNSNLNNRLLNDILNAVGSVNQKAA